MATRLTPRQQMMVRRATRRSEPDPSERPGELNIVPFLDVVVNLMLFLLATAAVTAAVAQTESETPASCRGCGGAAGGLDLSVTIADEGIFVASRTGRLAPGCAGTSEAASPTVARGAAGHDFAALRACLTRVSDRFPDEREVILSADPLVPYEDLIRAMDAARGDAERPLFPRVRLSAGLR